MRSQIQALLAVEGFCRWYVGCGLLPTDPNVALTLPQRPQQLPRAVLSAQEAETDLTQPDLRRLTGLRDRAILETLYSTGTGRSPSHVSCSARFATLSLTSAVGSSGRGYSSYRARWTPGRFEDAVSHLSSRVSRIYLHIDLDALDAGVARANRYAAPGGPDLDHLVGCIRLCCERFRVVAAAITAYDPEFDEDLLTLTAARRIAGVIAHGVGAR